ncbi:MAG TPA: valine--tRNA ligase [Candidatus Pacearchaeota archaeon]|nr:valine--tRNA ligase [Candidatus Pacearchaeota archaeon]HOK94334.1 valine--tRNA ligase [Candidatus Pacearchaeota archaeon]HPO75285.1 valine--tRNA ligase [Candidatus Pacearchaeota archaeon]
MEKQYNPQKVEKEIYSFWEKEKIYKFDPKKKGPFFVVDTPPPTISGKMHLGHAFSYSQQDFIVRYHRLKGDNIFYPFGTDDNGLPTEKLVEKLNNVRIFDLEREEFTRLCQKTLNKIRPDFINDWKKIGISCDFELSYSTISKDVQKLSQQYFIDLYKKGRAYRKKSPTLWCPKCQTAIAQADLEDKKEETFFNYIQFQVEDGGKMTIATTRPELISSCVAIFVNPKDKRYQNLIGKNVIVPIFGQKVKIYTDKRVEPEKGTGIVMCCTFGDTTDIDWYIDYNLPLKISLTKDGKMNELACSYQGLNIEEARKKIISDLENKGLLLKKEKIEHIVNTHERCGTKIEILDTTQWFIKYLDFKNDFLLMGRKMKWHPSYMRKRYENWVKGLRWDWCISRQRYFGIPFPIWYCQKCGKIKIASTKDLPVDPLHTQPKTKCTCGSNKFIPETDVFDTWATSSLSPQIAIQLIKNKNLQKKLFPMSLRPQAHDIINFWLFYTVARSKIHFNQIPWKEIMISGFVLDQKGEKMSKSKGNVVAPQEITEKYGADVLRHWAAKAGLGEDLRWSEDELKSSKRTIIKLWNASRFCFLNLKNFIKKDSKISADEDKWILGLLEKTLRNYCYYFDKYEFKKARETIDDFFWHNFCDNYLEIVKPRLYQENISFSLKESAQKILYFTLLSILKMYSPFMPFITEKLFQMYFRGKEKEKSIHLSLLPKFQKKYINQKTIKDFEVVIEIISAIKKYKSEKRLSLKGEINKLLIDAKNKKLEKYFNLLKTVMNVKEIEAQEIKKGGIKIGNAIKIKIQ